MSYQLVHKKNLIGYTVSVWEGVKFLYSSWYDNVLCIYS